MSQARNKRRLDKKFADKEQKEIVAGMTMLQRYILNGLKLRKISHEELVEMSIYYITSELEKKAESGELGKQIVEQTNELINSLGEKKNVH